MREDTVITKMYQFDELSDEAKETAIEKLYDINVGYDWWDSTYEDAKTIGLVIEEFDLDRHRHCAGKWTEDAEDAAHLIIENHGEQCETHQDATEFLDILSTEQEIFESQGDYDPEYEEFDETDKYEELCEEFLRTICEDYAIMLQGECEYLTGEEAIIETIEANKYEFTEDGELY